MSESPATVQPIEGVYRYHLARRWDRWLPWATLYAHDTKQTLEAIARRWGRAVSTCVAANIPWRTMTRLNLDDPRLNDSQRNRLIAQAAERRETRRKHRDARRSRGTEPSAAEPGAGATDATIRY